MAALCGAMSGALSAMVANLTVGKKDYADVQDEVLEIAPLAQDIKLRALNGIDADTDAFNELMDAMRLPRKSDEEKQIRDAAIEAATQHAILMPLDTMKVSLEALHMAERIGKVGNANALSDAGVAGLTALAAAKAAYYNIRINMPGVTDETFKKDTMKKADQILKECEEIAAKLDKDMMEKL